MFSQSTEKVWNDVSELECVEKKTLSTNEPCTSKLVTFSGTEVTTRVYEEVSSLENTGFPFIAFADDGEKKVATLGLEVSDKQLYIRVSDTQKFRINGAIEAIDLINCMYNLTEQTIFNKFNVTIIRNRGALESIKQIEEIDHQFSASLSRELDKPWSVIVDFKRDSDDRPRPPRPECLCEASGLCSSGHGAFCNAIKGKCHGLCDP